MRRTKRNFFVLLLVMMVVGCRLCGMNSLPEEVIAFEILPYTKQKVRFACRVSCSLLDELFKQSSQIVPINIYLTKKKLVASRNKLKEIDFCVSLHLYGQHFKNFKNSEIKNIILTLGDRLRGFHISFFPKFTHKILKHLPNTLQSLTIDHCRNIKKFTEISRLTKLKKLSIIGGRIEGGQIMWSRLVNLKKLSLSKRCDRSKGNAFKHITKAMRLTHIDLTYNEFTTDEGLEPEDIPNLKVVSLGFAHSSAQNIDKNIFSKLRNQEVTVEESRSWSLSDWDSDSEEETEDEQE